MQAGVDQAGEFTFNSTVRGVPDHIIRTLRHWPSDAYQIYIRTPVSSIGHVSYQLAV